jgi:hypothetical protein
MLRCAPRLEPQLGRCEPAYVLMTKFTAVLCFPVCFGHKGNVAISTTSRLLRLQMCLLSSLEHGELALWFASMAWRVKLLRKLLIPGLLLMNSS